MEKKINKKALVVSLIFALISCGLVFSYIKGLNKPIKEEEPKITLLVASRNIMVGEQINASDIKTMEVPEDALPEGIINDRKSIEMLYAKEPIIMGEPFRNERLTEWENLTLSFNIPKGKRAISIFVDENSVFTNQLRVGDKVDVVGNYTIKTADDDTVDLSKIVVQNIEVLAIGPSRVKKNTDNAESQSLEQDQLPRTVTLLVTPEDAEKISFTNAFADFSLILRGNEDVKIVDTPGVIIESLIPDSILERLMNFLDGGDQ